MILGILTSVFIFPNLPGNNESSDSNYTRITVFEGRSAAYDFGNYSYMFFYKFESIDISPSDGIVVGVRGIYQSVPSIAGSTYTILDLRITVSEVYDDYVVLLVKRS